MKTKFLLKLCSSLLMVILIISMCYGLKVSASSRFDLGKFEEKPSNGQDIRNITRNASQTAIAVVRNAAVAIAIIILIIISMRYMVSAPGERADIKKHAIPYVIGVVILFGSAGILTIIQKLSTVVANN